MKVKLRDVSNIIMGQSPDSSTYNTEKIGLPFFQGNADFGELNPIAKTWCSAPIKIAYKNYILISVRAPIGALNIAAETCCIGRGLAAFDVNNKMCTQKYLWYLLKAKKNELLSKGTGSTFKAISKNILSEMEFNIPPVREQELCTKVLDVVFCLIRLKKEQLDKLDLLVKSRFIEMFGDPVVNPRGLKKVLLAELSELITKGASPNWQGFSYTEDVTQTIFVTSENVREGFLDLSNPKYIEDSFNEKQRRSILRKGDFLINIVGASIGRAAQYNSTKKANINQAVALVRIKPSIIRDNYLIYYLNSDKAQRMYDSMKSDTGRANLSLQDISNLEILLPNLREQTEFDSFMRKVDKSKLAIQQSLDELETLKKSLMQQYFG